MSHSAYQHCWSAHFQHLGAGQGRAGQGRAGQGRAGQGRAGQGRAGQSCVVSIALLISKFHFRTETL